MEVLRYTLPPSQRAGTWQEGVSEDGPAEVKAEPDAGNGAGWARDRGGGHWGVVEGTGGVVCSRGWGGGTQSGATPFCSLRVALGLAGRDCLADSGLLLVNINIEDKEM